MDAEALASSLVHCGTIPNKVMWGAGHRRAMNPEFLSGEASASPAVEPLLAAARRFAEMGHGSGLLSARNGLRTTTHAHVPFEGLSAVDFVEVADYDPHLDRLLVIGQRSPHQLAGMHALILRAKKEVGAIAMIESNPSGLPSVKRGRTTLESALSVLEALRGRDAIAFGPYLLAVGRTPEEAVARAEALLA
jgi:hypothetical protein